jgi:hypothetical protein
MPTTLRAGTSDSVQQGEATSVREGEEGRWFEALQRGVPLAFEGGGGVPVRSFHILVPLPVSSRLIQRPLPVVSQVSCLTTLTPLPPLLR